MPTYTSTMTSKGQVTIPKELRDALGLKPSDRVFFSRSDKDGLTLRRKHLTVDDVCGMLADKPRKRMTPVSVEEMNEIIAQAAAESGIAGLGE